MKTTAVTSRKITIAAAVVATLGLSACGAVVDKAAEHSVEQGMERLIESSIDDELAGFDIDLDLSDGDFSIETDDGTFSFNDDGSVVLDTDQGVFTGQVDESGVQISDEDGSVVDIDIDASSAEGGSINVESDDGTFYASDDAGYESADWSNWPTQIAQPNFTADQWITGSADDNGIWIMAGGTVDGDPRQAVDTYAATFVGAAVTEHDWDDETVGQTITTNDFVISLLGDPNDLRGGTNLSITIASA